MGLEVRCWYKINYTVERFRILPHQLIKLKVSKDTMYGLFHIITKKSIACGLKLLKIEESSRRFV